MNGAETLLGALGGAAVFLTALFVMIKGVFNQVRATEDNTRALNDIKDELKTLNGNLADHDRRISHLEGRQT